MMAKFTFISVAAVYLTRKLSLVICELQNTSHLPRILVVLQLPELKTFFPPFAND